MKKNPGSRTTDVRPAASRTTGPAPVRRSGAVAALSPSRARVLEHLQRQQRPVRIEHLAHDLDMRDNTLRDHLRALLDDGLIARDQAPSEGRGRPAWLYSAHPERREPDRRVAEYAALAGALAEHITTTSRDPRAEARSAGKAWGHTIAKSLAPDGRQAREVVVDVLRDYDFDPVVQKGTGRTSTRTSTVRLRRCPLLDVAQKHPDVVCQVHEGLVAGVLAELGDTTTQVELLPFAESSACVLHLRGTKASAR